MIEEAENVDSKMPEYVPEKSTEKMRNQIHFLIAPDGWKESLQLVEQSWMEGPRQYQDRMRLFTEALALPNVPDLERKDAESYQTNATENYKVLTAGITAIDNGDRLKWSKIRELEEKADALLGDGRGEDEQAIAMCQAISETHTEGRKPEEIRAALARHSFTEIFGTGEYRTLDYTGAEVGEEVEDRTTQDTLSVEKNELVAALNAKPWDKEKLDELKKMKTAWKKVARSEDNKVEPETAEMLEKLWQAANGKGVKRQSGLDILQLAEDIYDNFQDGGAFDIDIFEVMEEMSEEEFAADESEAEDEEEDKE